MVFWTLFLLPFLFSSVRNCYNFMIAILLRVEFCFYFLSNSQTLLGYTQFKKSCIYIPYIVTCDIDAWWYEIWPSSTPKSSPSWRKNATFSLSYRFCGNKNSGASRWSSGCILVFFLLSETKWFFHAGLGLARLLCRLIKITIILNNTSALSETIAVHKSIKLLR